MPGRVAEIVMLGAFQHVFVELASGDRVVSACPNRPDISFERGQQVAVSLPPKACVLFNR
jgi:putative spermidine/putrescine transport system ATP-binding protein/putrescine transport system ATP-binding protein